MGTNAYPGFYVFYVTYVKVLYVLRDIFRAIPGAWLRDLTFPNMICMSIE